MSDEKSPLTRADMARITATLSHVGGILETLPLAQFAAELRRLRDLIPGTWEAHLSPVEVAERNRLRALLAIAAKADDIVDEVHTAQAYWAEARRLARAEQEPEVYVSQVEHRPTVAQADGTVLFPNFGRKEAPDATA